ncbi:hypothetical protein [Ensifer sp. 1H6]|uniref:hypothetical protein n=1 Tax=Ensifer sp. 1H6 TaxID=1911585 RepID=UPI001301280E|nr:hypothetical protein [Ensifer sp. 1H6]
MAIPQHAARRFPFFLHRPENRWRRGVQPLSERRHATMIVKHQATDKAIPDGFLQLAGK